MSVIAIRSALPLRLRRGLVLGQVGMSLHHKLCHVLCGTTTCRDRLHITSLTGMSAKDLGATHVSETGKPWMSTLGFSHAIFEVGLDAVKRATDLTDSASIMRAIIATDLQTIVGPVNWKNGRVKNVTKTPFAGGQWQRVDGRLELKIVNNNQNPQLPVTGEMKPLS